MCFRRRILQAQSQILSCLARCVCVVFVVFLFAGGYDRYITRSDMYMCVYINTNMNTNTTNICTHAKDISAYMHTQDARTQIQAKAHV